MAVNCSGGTRGTRSKRADRYSRTHARHVALAFPGLKPALVLFSIRLHFVRKERIGIAQISARRFLTMGSRRATRCHATARRYGSFRCIRRSPLTPRRISLRSFGRGSLDCRSIKFSSWLYSTKPVRRFAAALTTRGVAAGTHSRS